MSEFGFYHPTVGYWQTSKFPSATIIESYPAGTIQVPLKPGQNYQWINSAWVYVEPVVVPAPKIPAIIATAKLRVDELGISGFGTDSTVAGGFRIDTGIFYIYFSAPLVDSDYIVSPIDSGIKLYVKPDEYYTDGFIITMEDPSTNEPLEPQLFSLIIVRAE